jgi:hypothetical protein
LDGKDADFDCMPMNMDVLDPASASTELQGGSSSGSAYAASFHARRTADCKNWNPNMPELLGLYHAYVRGYNKDIWCVAVCQSPPRVYAQCRTLASRFGYAVYWPRQQRHIVENSGFLNVCGVVVRLRDDAQHPQALHHHQRRM